MQMSGLTEKALPQHAHACSFMYYLWLLSHYNDRGHYFNNKNKTLSSVFFFLKVTLLTGVCEWHLLEPCRLQRAWLQAVLIATFFKWSIKEAKSLAPTLRQKLSQWFVENNFNADSCP